MTGSSSAFVRHYKCPVELADFDIADDLCSEPAYFRFGDAICYGRTQREPVANGVAGFADLLDDAGRASGRPELPFDLCDVVANLREERYRRNTSRPSSIAELKAARRLYYLLRPLLPVRLRRHLQKAGLNGWSRIAFPRWPVDFTVDTIMDAAMTLRLKASGDGAEIPFIWFWPDGAPSCGLMTHDVETKAGRDFCGPLMDIDDAYGIKSAFQIVPEARYDVPDTFLEDIRARGFEINVHDLNHSGHLFRSREEFLQSAARINAHAAAFKSRGFRAGAMYRRQDWFHALECSYDMSVPNVAHLDPQRGGCCTVRPYFIGKILELPLTTIQDYSLFQILNDYSIELWTAQIAMIRARHGLISFIVHPDYVIEQRARAVYLNLLAHLRRLRDERQLWLALPRDVDRWWRNRDAMTVVRERGGWTIKGPDSHRARLAYASLSANRLVYRIDAGPGSPPVWHSASGGGVELRGQPPLVGQQSVPHLPIH